LSGALKEQHNKNVVYMAITIDGFLIQTKVESLVVIS
jgi:hypothetical protein